MSSQNHHRRASSNLSTSLLFVLLALFLTTTTPTQVSAKRGHYPPGVTDISGPCIKRCEDIYKTDFDGCKIKFSNAPQNLDYCRLDAAIMFQKCSATCIPAAASFSEK
ncbi:hypothetical protein BGW39_005347 [Mortierella sp. 14UC]|nr:hypothetical protein BGW39_005347 [Mortierella sp. 14UC]